VPELQASNVSARPIIKADCIRFVSTFRSHLPDNALLALFPALVRLLGAPSNVVHSYAASCIERLMAARAHGKPRFSPTNVAPFLQPLLEGLFSALTLPDSGENEYVVRALTRAVTFAGSSIAPVAAPCLSRLGAKALEVCENPTHPGFNHFLFEAVAAVVRHGVGTDPAALSAAEAALFPPFETVLANDVQEFHPYVFQVENG
jgi:exportin-2 (importin alpha re-exporter)